MQSEQTLHHGNRRIMRKKPSLVLLPFLVLLIGSTSGQQTKSCPLDNHNKVDVTFDDVRRTSSFGVDLFRKVKAQVPGKNVFFSPYSVWSVLATAYFGAEGRTLTQLQNVLKLGEKNKGYRTQRELSLELGKNTGVQLEEANRAYFDSNLVLEECFNRSEFHDLHQFDSSDADGLAREVNQFVNKATKGLIPDLVDADSLRGVVLFLVNAVYFKGSWEKPFIKTLTGTEDFFCNPGKPCGKVEMMMDDSYFNYVSDSHLSADVIELPYSNSSISMLLFLPWENDNTVDGVVDRLDLPTLKTIIANLRGRRVLLRFPKFKMEQTLESEMLVALADLGITDLFSNNADLSAFTKSVALRADKIFHKAVVDVNEEGTEAAAASGVSIVPLSLPPRITFNRPFVFLIVDKKLDLVLFNGIFRTPPQ